MRDVTRLLVGALVLVALLIGCSRNPVGEPTLAPTSQAPTPAPLPTATPSLPAPTAATPSAEGQPLSPDANQDSPSIPTASSFTDEDLDAGLEVVRNFLTRLSEGGFREVYGSFLTTGGQQRLADLILGRLALSNPHIGFFELLGAEPVADHIAVDVNWQEFYEGQGLVGSQQARVLLARQNDAFLVDDVELAEYEPAATPVPPPLPKAEALTSPAAPGQEMRFRASGFEDGETALTWLESPDGNLMAPTFQTADETGVFEVAYPSSVTGDLEPGRWIWWAQALRDSTRNTGITFEVLARPTPTSTPTPQPTATPRPQATTPPRPTATPTPGVSYPAPVVLYPELETSLNFGSALIVELAPVAEQLAADEFYQLSLTARNLQGAAYYGGAVQSKGDACPGRFEPCVRLIADERFMSGFHMGDVEGQGTWQVQVVRQTGPNQFTPISPPSEPRILILKPRS